MLIPPLPREPNLSPTRFLYGIWQNLLGNTSLKLPPLPRDPNIAPTPLLNAIWEATKNGMGGLPNQAGHAGEFLGTDGTTASWMAIPGGGDMLAAVYDPAGVSAQLAGASGQAINAGLFRTALGATATGNGVFLAASAAAGQAALGATTVGGNFFSLANPGAITFPRINADNTVSALNAATFRGAIGAGTSSLVGSTGGNGAADAGKAALFDGSGSLTAERLTLINTAGGSQQLFSSGANLYQVGANDFTLAYPAVLGGSNVATFQDVTGTIALLSDIPSTAGFAQLAAANNFTTNGAASVSPILLSGSIMTGGSGTTNFPNFLIQPTGATASTSWNTSGTAMAVNLNIGAGNFFDFKVDGVTFASMSTTRLFLDPRTGTDFTGGAGVFAMNMNNSQFFIADAGAGPVLNGLPSLGIYPHFYISGASGSFQTYVTSPSANILQLGLNANGTTAQMLTASNQITADGTGANLTLSGGNGRGGAGGSVILSTYDTQGAGTIGNLISRITIDTSGTTRLESGGNLLFVDGVNLTFGGAGGTRIGTSVVEMLGFYGATPIVQPTRPGQLTDNSGGTSGGGAIGTIGGAVDPTAASQVDTANAVATLASRLNALEAVFSTAASGLGLYS